MRPGSHTKVSVPLLLPQNRHPEPERTRISCSAALTSHLCGFQEESRMNSANATSLNRKSRVAQWRDLLFPSGIPVSSRLLATA